MDHEDACPPTRVKLVASTGDITATATSAAKDGGGDIRGYFEAAQWTADGTTLLTSSSSNLISGYIVPRDLLSPRPAPHALRPSAHIPLPEPSSVLAGAPYFNLAEPWTNQLLVSSRDHPIQLFYLTPNATTPSDPDSPAAAAPAAASSYPLTKARSETFLTAASLVWPAPGAHFFAGARSLLAKYDVSRGGGGEPLARIKTIPSERHLAKGGGVGMRGTVSALGAQPLPSPSSSSSLLAAGTWTRWVGLYDFNAPAGGECVATWSIASAAAETGEGKGTGIGGDGVTQTVWSPCGRYLLIGERKSRGVLVYDVRVTGQLLGWLSGREALGNQRIDFDVFPGQEEGGGFEVWSGTSGGAIRVWEGVGSREGPHEPSWAWDAHRRSTVGSACVHPSGSVVATCSGSWEFPDDEDDEDDSDDGGGLTWMRRRNKESSLKIWSISGGQDEEDTELQEEMINE